MERTPVCVVLDKIRSLYNVGAIFRTSDAILAEKLYLGGYTGCPPRKEITKTALGAEETVPWEHFDESTDAIKHLKEKGYEVIAVELAHDSQKYSNVDYKAINKPICLVLGHEVDGISDEVMKLVDTSIFVPMLGRANSLNVATCYGVVAYEILKSLHA